MFKNNLTFLTRKDPNGNAFPIENRKKVFISYKKSDNRFQLRNRIINYILTVVDCAVWFDESLTPGIDYDDEISEAIKASDVIVLLLTENILDSDYVWNIEIKQALNEKKGIIPILLNFDNSDSNKATALEQRLGHRQLLDGRALVDNKISPNDEINKFLESLTRALEQFLLRQDLVLNVLSFYAANKHKIPIKSLSVEQLFYLSFGLLNGLGTKENSNEATKILSSLLQLYANDEETNLLKAEIIQTLIKYYVEQNDFVKAKEYINKIDEYNHAPLYCYVGSLYQGVIEDNFKIAFKYFVKGAQLNHIESIRNAANSILNNRNYWGFSSEEAFHRSLPYFIKLADLGGSSGLIELLVSAWNNSPNKVDRKFVCDRLINDPQNSLDCNLAIAEFLKTVTSTTSYLQTTTIKEYDFIDPKQRRREIVFKGHSFYIYFEQISEKKLNMLLFRDNKVISTISCYTPGWGDMDSFDLYVEDNYIVLKHADFCHYDRSTSISQHVFLNPISSNLLICVCRFEEEPGRMILGVRPY